MDQPSGEDLSVGKKLISEKLATVFISQTAADQFYKLSRFSKKVSGLRFGNQSGHIINRLIPFIPHSVKIGD